MLNKTVNDHQGRLYHIGELGKCLGRQNLWGGKIGPKFLFL